MALRPEAVMKPRLKGRAASSASFRVTRPENAGPCAHVEKAVAEPKAGTCLPSLGAKVELGPDRRDAAEMTDGTSRMDRARCGRES